MARPLAKEKLTENNLLHPKHTEQLIAHMSVEKQLLAMINANKLPHALLITGEKGIGKATLAYRLARFLLAPAEVDMGSLFGNPLPPESLFISPETSTFKKIISGSHPDLLVLEGDDIKIDKAREVGEFLSLKPAESSWRVVIVDSVDAMNRNAANALLKILEEPPSQAVLILVSHNYGRLLPTIRSRCRQIRMAKLSEIEFAKIMANIAPDISPADYSVWGELSGFSAGVSLTLIENKADILYKELLEIISTNETSKLHSFAEKFAKKENEKAWQTLTHLVLFLLKRIAVMNYSNLTEIFVGEKNLLKKLFHNKSDYTLTDLWERSIKLMNDTDNLYLDKKQTIITIVRAI